MRSDAALERETILAFLADLPDGAHAAVRLESLTTREVEALCEEAARERDERLLVAGRDLEFGRTRPADLARLAQAARASGHRGALVMVDGDEGLARDAAAHVQVERGLGPDLPQGVRIVCVYRGAPGDELARVLPTHRERLDGQAWQVS